MKMRQMIAIVITALAIAGAGMAEPKSLQQYPKNLEKLSNEFMESFFEFQPSAATRAGFHQYDTRMESYDAARVAQPGALCGKYEKRIEGAEHKGWSRWAQDDREMLLCFVHSRIFELETQRVWRQNPDYYSS